MYTPVQVILLFFCIPAAVFALVFFAVYAPGWIRSGKSEEAESADRGAVQLTSPRGSMSAPSGPGIETPSGPTEHLERGGSSAQW
ncbi:MAG: hypothetical protein ACKOT0_12915 [bacterium]